MGFYVFMCKYCGRWGVREVRSPIKRLIHRERFQCKYCNKSMLIKEKKHIGLALNHNGPYILGKEAAQVCGLLNNPKEMIK